MIAPTLAIVALASSHALGPTCDDTPQPVPPSAVVMEQSPTALDHYNRDLEIWWGRKHLCQIDTRAPRDEAGLDMDAYGGRRG